MDGIYMKQQHEGIDQGDFTLAIDMIHYSL